MKYVKIGQLVDLKQGLAINAKSNHLISKDETNIALLRIADMPTKRKVIYMKEETPERYIANKNDIIYTRTGQVGLVFTGQHGVVHNNCFRVFSKNDNILLNEYLYWCLRLKSVYIQANNFAVGSAQPDLPHTSFRKIRIPLFSINAQNKIAKILQKYDDLIEKNNRKIAILEEQIQELYKEWFVKFRFPESENVEFVNGIPKGWSINRIGECCENVVIGGDAPNDFLEERTKDYKYPIYSNGIVNDGLYGYSKTYKVSKASVTVSARGTVGFVCMRNTEYTPIVRLISLIPKDFIKLVYFYQNLKYVDLGGNGTSQQQLTAPMIMKRKMLLADQKVICMYDNIAHKIFEEIDKLKKSNNNMSVTRDLLLPRLMSGKLKV